MNVKTFCFNKKIFTHNIKKLLPLTIAFFVIELLISISTLKSLFADSIYTDGVFIADNISNEAIKLNYFDSMAGLGNHFVMVLFAFFCGSTIFHYMFQPKLCKTIHSLPVSRKGMFISGILSGLTLIIIPTLLNGLISGIYVAAKGYSFLCVLPAVICQLAYLFIFLCIAVLATMLTGHIVAIPIMFGFLNFGYFITEQLCSLLTNSFVYGLNGTMSLGHTIFTPFIHIFTTLNMDKDTCIISEKGIHALIIYCIAGIALLILSYILYKKRAIENQGDPIAAKRLEPVFHYLSTLIISIVATIILWAIININTQTNQYYMMSNIIEIIVIYLILSVITFYIIKMLFKKTIKVFSTKNPGLVVYIALSVVVFSSATFDVFGLEKKIPQTEDIKSVSVHYSGSMPFTITEEEEIEELIEIHKGFIDNKKNILSNNDNVEYDYYGYVEISYLLENNKKITRYYDYCFNQTKQTDADKKINALDNKIHSYINDNDIISSTLATLKNVNDITVFEVEYDKAEEVISYNDSFTFSNEDFSDIILAIQKDSKNNAIAFNHYHLNEMPEDVMYEIDISGLDGEYYYEFIITPESKYTLKALSDHNAINVNGEIQINHEK